LRDERITNAGILLFGKEPQRHILQSEIRCARFKGNEPVTFIDMKVVSGTVIEQIDKVEQFVQTMSVLVQKSKGSNESRNGSIPWPQ